MKCNTILKPVTRMVFQCTWRCCGYECDVREKIEEHVRVKHLGITSCTDDHEEDFYYTEVELDSPLDSSGVSSDGSPIHEPSNNNSSLSTTNSSTSIGSASKQTRKRGQTKFQNKNLIIESSNYNCNFYDNHNFNSAIATWMHMDMARPAHEDPEYLSKLNDNFYDATSVITNVKREKKKASANQYTPDQSDFESLNSQQQQAQYKNLTAEQLVKLQQQNNLHLKNNIQHLQQLQRQHLNQIHQLHQYQQQVKRKYTKSQCSGGSILMPSTTRTKSVICNMAQLESDYLECHHHSLNASLSPNPLKRSKPIKIPGISLAHRDAVYQQPNHSPSFTVGSVQLSPNSYFHCFSPTPPHSLSSPTSSNSSMYSLGSCNSPGSSSITSNSSSYSPNCGQSLNINRNSSNYSSIDTLLQTVENERLQQLAVEDELSQTVTPINLNNCAIRKIQKLKSANVSDLDLVAQNEDDTPDQQIAINLKQSKEKNELSRNHQTSEFNSKCTNDNSLFNENTNPVNKSISSVIKNGPEALLASKNLTVDCEIVDNHHLSNDLQIKQQQLVQTAQQALVTLAEASTLYNSTKDSTTSINNKSSQIIIEKSNSITNNSTNSQINNLKNNQNNNENQQTKLINQQNNGLLIAANQIIQSTNAEQKKQSTSQQTTNTSTINNQEPFNYLVSQSGRTIKPTAAAKSYVQRKNRIAKHTMRAQNSSSNSSGKNGLNKSKNSNNLIQFENLLESAQADNNNQTGNSSTSTNLNLVRNSIISSVGNLNNSNSASNNQTANETQSQINSMPIVQRTPTGRIRNSGAKCRKKYGMENKHQWCVQCRWKKACSRVDSNSGLNHLTQYNNQSSGSSTERTNRSGRPGRPENTSNNQSDQRRAVPRATSSNSVTTEQNQRNNATSDYSAIAEEMLRTGTLLNNQQRTAVSAK